jgi:hypothetical protein
MVRSVSTWGAWTHGTVREDRVQLGSIVARTRGPLTARFHRSLHTQYTKFVSGAPEIGVVSPWRFGRYTPRVVGRV